MTIPLKWSRDRRNNSRVLTARLDTWDVYVFSRRNGGYTWEIYSRLAETNNGARGHCPSLRQAQSRAAAVLYALIDTEPKKTPAPAIVPGT